jgi:hypothetical protein
MNPETQDTKKKARAPRKTKAIEATLSEVRQFDPNPEPIKINKELTDFDWKSLIPEEYFEINPSWPGKTEIENFDNLSKEEKIKLKSQVPDEYLLIKLAGFKYLAKLRGVQEIDFDLKYANEDHVSAKCTITLPDAEFEGKIFKGGKFSGLASATKENTIYPFSSYLESMVENRSFIRAVKVALNINVLGAEEVNGSSKAVTTSLMEEEAPMNVQDSLKAMISAKGKTFADLKKNLEDKKWENHESWQDYKDIPTADALLIINTIVNKSLKK